MDHDKSGQPAPARHLLPAILVCGLAIVVFHSAWSALAPPVFGTRPLANAGVTLALLVGLLVGSCYAAPRTGRMARPHRIFGLLQIGAGASAIAALLLLSGLETFYRAIVRGFHGAGVSSLVGVILVFAVLFVPSFLLGAALPIGLNLLRSRKGSVRAGGFFPMILLGLSAGILISGYGFMPYLGAWISLVVPAAALSAMGTLCLLSRGGSEIPRPEEPQPTVLGKAGIYFLATYAVYVFSGAICLTAWMRLLLQSTGTAVYASVALFGVFFAAAGLGAVASDLIGRRGQASFYRLGVTCGVSGVLWLVPLFLVNALPFAFLKLFGLGAPVWHGLVAAYFGLGLLVMLLPGILMGSTLLLAERSLTPSGWLLPVTILGVLVAAIASSLVPGEGLTMRRILVAAPWLTIASGLVLMVSSGKPVVRRLAAAPILIVIALSACILAPAWNQGITTSGVYVSPDRFPDLKNLERSLRAADVVSYREDRDRVVSVLRSPDGLFLRANGSPIGSTADDLASQMLAAHVPLALSENHSRILVIGLSTGVTIGSAETHGIGRIDCVEPVPAVAKASRYFAPYNNNALAEAAFNLFICDPANYLLLSPGKYDVIVSHQIVAVGESARLLRAALAPGGIVCQVADLDEISEQGVKSLAKEFAYYFPHVDLWWTGGNELLLLASLNPHKVQADTLRQRIAAPKVRGDFQRLGRVDAFGFLTFYMMGREALLGWAGDVPMSTRNRPFLLYQAPKGLLGRDNSQAQALADINERHENPTALISGLEAESPEYMILTSRMERCLDARTMYFRALVAAKDRKFRETAAYLQSAKDDCPENGIFRLKYSDFFISFSRLMAQEKRFQDAVNAARRAVDENPDSYRALYNLAGFERQRDPLTAAGLLQRATELNPDYLPAYLLLAQAEITLGKIDAAGETVARVLSLEPFNAAAHHLRALCFIQRGMIWDARQDLEFAIKADPTNAEALSALAYTWLLEENLDKAQTYYEKTLKIDPSNLEALNNLASILAEKQQYGKAVRIWERALQLDQGNQSIMQNIKEARQKMRQS